MLKDGQGVPWSWKVMEFRKTIFQAWKVVENSKGHGKAMEMMVMSWNRNVILLTVFTGLLTDQF